MDVKIVCVTKLGGFYDSDNNVLMEVTDPKLYFQYNVFVAILYCCFMYLLKQIGLYYVISNYLYDLDYIDCITVYSMYTFLGSNEYSCSCSWFLKYENLCLDTKIVFL